MRLSEEKYHKLANKQPKTDRELGKWVDECVRRSLERRIKEDRASDEDMSTYIKLRAFDDIENTMWAIIAFMCVGFVMCCVFAAIG